MVLLGLCLVLLCGLAVNGVDAESDPYIEPEPEPAPRDEWTNKNIENWLAESEEVVTNHDQCGYIGLNMAYEKCSRRQHPLLEDKVHNYKIMSGKDVVEVLELFCLSRHDIHRCVEQHMHDNTCQEESFMNFEKGARISESYCFGIHVKESVAAIYKDLPNMGTRPSEDPCMKMASDRYYTCLYPILLAAALQGVADYKEKMKWQSSNMLCVLKGFGTETCPVAEGILLTSLVHSRMLVPPVLGVNVTRSIECMESYLQQRKGHHEH